MKSLGAHAFALLLSASLLFAGGVQAAPQVFAIDPAHSSVEFTIRHMFSKVSGRFAKFQGTIQYDAAAPASSSVKAEIDASSIDTNNERRDGHLKSPDFFDAAKYPTITFTSTKLTSVDGRLKVDGTLAMHGVTKPVTLEAAFLGAGPGMDGVLRAGFEGTTKVDRKDFGILWNKALDQGTLLGDEVTINLQIEAVAPKPESEDAKKEEPKKEEAKKSTKSAK